MPKLKARVSVRKARKILHDGMAQGHPMTAKQKRFFGVIAGVGKRRG